MTVHQILKTAIPFSTRTVGLKLRVRLNGPRCKGHISFGDDLNYHDYVHRKKPISIYEQ